MSWIQTVLSIECVAVVMMVACALGHRLGWLPFKLSFLLFLLLGLVLTFGALAATVAMIKSPSMAQLPALFLGLLPLIAFFALVGSGGLKAPKIHDISTRQQPPIQFQAVPKLRRVGENSLEPASDRVMALQLEFYKDIGAIELSGDINTCFDRLIKAVERFGWVVVDSDREAAWLEAYESTFLFGFKDDIRVELSPKGAEHCQVDARSVSRVGVSDLGVNAKRIQSLFEALKQLE